jgi:hypothetical protein
MRSAPCQNANRRKNAMQRRKYKLLIALCPTLLIAWTAIIAQDKKVPDRQEQTFFTCDPAPDEQYARAPITLPENAIQILKKSEAASRCHTAQIDTAWFVGSKIHLADAGETDIIVMPSLMDGFPPPNMCVRGAHTNPYWVIRKVNNGYHILFDTNASTLSVMDSRTNGYRDIEITFINLRTTITEEYHFDGTIYKQHRRQVTVR